MGTNEHIIELNGKRYDAKTGKTVAIKPSKSTISAIKSASLDGFARAVKPILRTGTSVSHHQTEKSKTLMRKTVKPPKPKSHVNPNTHNTSSLIHKSPSVVPSTKFSKAKSIQKSSLVRRFNDMVASTAQNTVHQPKSDTTERVQAVATVANLSQIERGLENADSHTQQKHKKQRTSTRIANKLHISPRTLSASSLVLAVLIIGGFFAYQNMSNISMRLASSRAGVKASLPDYQPAGFGLKDGISYSPGQIVLGYNSNSDDRSFKIIQSTSSWNSETLVENYDALKDDASYQTVPVKGKTVYLFDGSNATWVDGGIWYRIEGDSKLNSDQLLNIANSL